MISKSSLISLAFLPGRGISYMFFSLNIDVNIVSNTGDHIERVDRWTWNFWSSTTRTTSLNFHGSEKSGGPTELLFVVVIAQQLYYEASHSGIRRDVELARQKMATQTAFRSWLNDGLLSWQWASKWVTHLLTLEKGRDWYRSWVNGDGWGGGEGGVLSAFLPSVNFFTSFSFFIFHFFFHPK